MLETYQTLISAGIGFLGIVITLLVNAGLARKQVQEHWQQASKTIENSLKTEISMLKTVMQNQMESFDQRRDNSNSFLVPTRRLDEVFSALVSEIGRLEPEAAIAVIECYAQYGTYLDRLKLLGHKQQDEVYYDIEGKWVGAVSSHCKHVLEKAENALRKLKTE